MSDLYHHFYRWRSAHLNREMDLLVYGHAGARVLVFPTSHGGYHEWRDREMVAVLGHHLREGWIQLYCLDAANSTSWYASYLPVGVRIEQHLAYERYILDEVLPLSRHLNANPYLIATGASFGAFLAALLAFRHPEVVDRIIGLSGFYDAERFLGPGTGAESYFVNPVAFLGGMTDEAQRARLRRLDIILAIGREDSSFANNLLLSNILWSSHIWHAFRVWDGWSHDWPYWQEMILHYIGGPDSR